MVPNEALDKASNSNNGVVSQKQKYKELKKRLKYLVYESECFEHDVRQAQTKLLQLCREKSFLLDQLMRHETVVLSEDSDIDSTDYSSEEEVTDRALDSSLRSVQTPKASNSTLPQKNSALKSSIKKGTAKSSNKQTKAVKVAAKTMTVIKTTPATSLIVSVPFTNIEQSAAQAKPVSSLGEDSSSLVSSLQKDNQAYDSSSSSNSSSSSSSSDSDSDDSASQSSDSGGGQEEAMETSAPLNPPPACSPLHAPPLTAPSPPKMVDLPAAAQVGDAMIQPKPLPSPVKIMAPNQLTSLALVSPTGIPLISPLASPADKSGGIQTTYAITANRQGSFELVPITTTHAGSNPKIVASLTKPSSTSAFHVVTTSATSPPPTGNGGKCITRNA